MAAKPVKAKAVLATAAKPRSTGFGESKLNVAPEGSFTPQPDEIDILECHVAGIPVKDLPRENQMRLLYQQTDEGQAWWEANKKDLENKDSRTGPSPSGRGMKLADGRTATDVQEKLVVKYRDELSTGFDENRATEDPFAEPMRLNLPAGHRGLFMSLRQCERMGMNRGGLKYEPVLVKDSKGNWERVIILGMFLASIPEAAAQAQEAYYARRNKEKQVTVIEKVRTQADQVMAEAGMRNLAQRRHVLDDLIGTAEDEAQGADAELVHQFVEAGN